MQNNIPTVYISKIYCCIVKSTNLSTILLFRTKNMKNLRISCCHGHTSARTAFRGLFLNTEDEGSLHACISSYIIIILL